VPQEKIAEGKTKIIWATEIQEQVLIESKNDITAGDGAKRDSTDDKSVLSTEITCNCFSLLNAVGIPTHFIKREGEQVFLARLVKMLRVELVARRIATGSYLQRHPKVEEGTIFPELVFEMFYKDDSQHDPLMIWNGARECVDLYNAHMPIGPKTYLFTNPCDLQSLWGDKLRARDFHQFAKITRDVFLVFERAWSQQNVALVYLKIEGGWDPNNKFVVADVIDNDSWRIWPGGDKSQMKDKQVYRNLQETTTEALGKIKENYAWVAEATKKFVHS